MKRVILTITALVLLLPGLVNAGFTLGEKGKKSLTFSGAAKFGFDYDIEAEKNDPNYHFNVSFIKLYVKGELAPNLIYFWESKFDDGKYTLLKCNVTWTLQDMFYIKAGQIKAPFDRYYTTSGNKLLFKGRSCLTSFCPQYQVGLSTGLNLLDKKFGVNLGVVNGEGKNFLKNMKNGDNNIMFASNIVISPLGPVPMDESAHKGYEKPLFSLVPGFYVNPVQTADETVSPVDYDNTTTMAYGGHVAFRYNYLAFDAGCYGKNVDNPSFTGSDDMKSLGVSGQIGYAILGKFEPIFRASWIDNNLDVDEKDDITIEGGLNYYIKSYSSRIGLNYFASLKAGEMSASNIKLYYQLLW